MLTLGSMEVIEVAEDKFWLHEGGSVPPGAEDYDGPPPIPLDQVRRDLPAGWTAERAWYFSVGDDGQVNVVPTTIVESPNGDVFSSSRGCLRASLRRSAVGLSRGSRATRRVVTRDVGRARTDPLP